MSKDDKLVLGNSHGGGPWSRPASPGSGLVWFGLKKATKRDLELLDAWVKDNLGPNVKYSLDEKSLVGRHHPDWSSDHYDKVKPKHRPGGLGSRTFEMQDIKEGVMFAKEPLWHFNRAGKLVFAKPKGHAGAFHRVYDENDPTYSTAVAGPRPGSPAARQIGRLKKFAWNAKGKKYGVKPK